MTDKLKIAISLHNVGPFQAINWDLENDGECSLEWELPLPRYEMKPKLIGSLFSCSPASTKVNSTSTGIGDSRSGKSRSVFEHPPTPTCADRGSPAECHEPFEFNCRPRVFLPLESPQNIRIAPKTALGSNPWENAFALRSVGESVDKAPPLRGDRIHRNSDLLILEENAYGIVSKKLINFMDYCEYRVFQMKVKNKESDLKSLISDNNKAYVEMSLEEFKSRFQHKPSSSNCITVKPKSILKNCSSSMAVLPRNDPQNSGTESRTPTKSKKVVFSPNFLVLHYTVHRSGRDVRHSSLRKKSSFSIL